MDELLGRQQQSLRQLKLIPELAPVATSHEGRELSCQLFFLTRLD
jgi:hypothetical protein